MSDKHRIDKFRESVLKFYTTNRRDFVWRHHKDPYFIVVSEIMLQQTQTHRVAHKFSPFVAEFPSLECLAQAQWPAVLQAWQGLGYNRRAKRLHELAAIVVRDYHANLPQCPVVLERLPGIGQATAASICAFAFNTPTVFVETNIRAVFIHHFFPKDQDVHDNAIIPLVKETLDVNNPRDWYYALMDYGVFLKKYAHNPARRSAHHTRQSPFNGSDRHVRSLVIRSLIKHKAVKLDKLVELLQDKFDGARVSRITHELCQEGLIKAVDDLIILV